MTDWYEQGLCHRMGLATEMFFPDNRRSVAAKRAKAYCKVCPVRQECLAEALRVEDTHGIWGGLDWDERAALTQGVAG